MKTTEIVAVARMFDEAGYDGLICSDHLIYPHELSSPYPDSPTGRPGWPPETAWPDSWVLIGAMAAVTRRLRFSNAVYIAPARPLLEVAKQVATASVLSDGRVSLGVGVGWMREEYELLGQDFDTRGKRLNEMIPALRQLWRGGWVSWSGQYYQVPELMRGSAAGRCRTLPGADRALRRNDHREGARMTASTPRDNGLRTSRRARRISLAPWLLRQTMRSENSLRASTGRWTTRTRRRSTRWCRHG